MRTSSSNIDIKLGAAAWIFAIQFFVAQVVVQSAWTGPFSLADHYISDLGNTSCGPYRVGSSELFVCSPLYPWMNMSFALLGLSILVGAALVRHAFPPGRARTWGLAMVALAGPGALLVGLFPEDVNLALHKLGAAAQFVSGNGGQIVLGACLIRARRWTVLGVYSILSGAVGLVATALFVAERFCGIGIGGMERCAAYPLPIWLVIIGMHLVATRASAPARME